MWWFHFGIIIWGLFWLGEMWDWPRVVAVFGEVGRGEERRHLGDGCCWWIVVKLLQVAGAYLVAKLQGRADDIPMCRASAYLAGKEGRGACSTNPLSISLLTLLATVAWWWWCLLFSALYPLYPAHCRSDWPLHVKTFGWITTSSSSLSALTPFLTTPTLHKSAMSTQQGTLALAS